MLDAHSTSNIEPHFFPKEKGTGNILGDSVLNEKAAVLLDGMYLQNILNVYGLFAKVDYQRLSDKLALPHERARTYVFDALPYEGSLTRTNKQRFLDRLKYLDKFQVEEGYVKMDTKECPACKSQIKVPRQKKVDILIATRLLECSFDDRISKIVLVAGDADFVPAVEIAKKRKELVIVYAEEVDRNIGVSTDLKKACDGRIRLHVGYFDDCMLPGATQ